MASMYLAGDPGSSDNQSIESSNLRAVRESPRAVEILRSCTFDVRSICQLCDLFNWFVVWNMTFMTSHIYICEFQ